jgi:hypothetical protein
MGTAVKTPNVVTAGNAGPGSSAGRAGVPMIDVRENGVKVNAELTRPDSAPFGQATRPDRQDRQS